MPGKQVAPPEVFRVAVTATASSVAEAIQQFTPVSAPGKPKVWGAIKKTAKKAKGFVSGLFGKKKEETAPLVEEPEAQVQVEPEPQVQMGGDGGGDTGGGGDAPPPQVQQEGVGQAPQDQGLVEGVLNPVVEFAQQEPHVRLAFLYGQMGATDAFLRAVYADGGLRQAALDLGAARLVGFLAKDTLSDAAVQEAPAAFGNAFDPGIQSLPVGSAMPADVRRGLRRLVPAMTTDQAAAAFAIRFAHGMTNESGAWSLAMIMAVWDQLDVIPDQDISDLTVLTTFQAISGGGGFGPSWEAPDTVNTIQIGEDNDPATIGHTVRHEIGHAVHAQIPAQINPWLENDIGFWFYEKTDGGIRTLINELGGFPATFTAPDGTVTPWDANGEAWAIYLLQNYIGPGSSWSPAVATVTEGQDPWATAYWDAMPASVKEVVAQSPAHWYNNYANFAPGTKGQYFLNYWYGRSFYMSATARQVVAASGDNYTAMSEKEFFANAYAEYFEDPAGYNDHSLWGGSLPGAVKDFFARVIVDRQPYQPPNPQQQQNAQQVGQQPPPPTGMAGTP